jgi:hypothetical protein
MDHVCEEKEEKSYRTLLEYIKSIKYGTVVAVIQDGKIIQIEKNEKIRLV